MSDNLYVGQAIVTDPLLEGASGYLMTAVSGSVAAEDRVHLTEFPQVSDYMHMEKALGSFLSFHQLPSGSWALSQRFVHGIRRRTYNRVVVHTLVISGALLEAVLDDPWLLVVACGYRDPEGQWQKFKDLSRFVGEPDIREVSDLQVQLPEDIGSARNSMLQGRCEYLLRYWKSAETLYEQLAHVLAAIEAGDKILLPQEIAMEQLLALAYSSLPSVDRLRINWTTHLAIGGGEIFHLALTPNPIETRYRQNDPDRWILLGEQLKRAGSGGRSLARIVALRFDRFGAIDTGLTTYKLSLLENSESLARWINMTLEEGGFPSEGFADAQGLAAFLERHRLSGRAIFQVPGLNPSMMLETVALTIINQYIKNNSWEEAVRAVSRVFNVGVLGSALVVAEEVAKLIRCGKTERQARVAIGSLALCLASPDLKDDQLVVVVLLEAAQARGALMQAACMGWIPVLFDLAESIVRLAPERTEAAYQLVQVNGGLKEALDRLASRNHNLMQLQAILRAAQEVGDFAVVGQVADFLLPLLAKESHQAIAKELAESVLRTMREQPERLVRAFAEWKKSDLYDLAMRTLRQWADERVPGIIALVERLISYTDDEASVHLIHECPSVLRTPRALADAGVPAASWLPFAMVEASLIDKSGSQADLLAFRDFLRREPIQEKGIERSLHDLVACFQLMPPVTSLGAAHSELVICLAAPLGREPAKAANALAQLANNPSADLLLWGEAVTAVATVAAETDTRVASQMACNWWTGLTIAAPLRLDMLTDGSFRLLDLLSREDARAVLDHWKPKISSREPQSGVERLLEGFESLARKHNLQDQKFSLSAISCAYRLRIGEQSLEEAVEATIRRAGDSGQSKAQLESALARLFPDNTTERTRTIIQLLVSQEAHPAAKEFIEERFLGKALELPPPGLAQALLPVDQLVCRNSLLLKVSQQMGRHWQQWSNEAVSFVSRLAILDRSDALGSFFRGAEESGASFVAYVKKNESSLYGRLQYIVNTSMGRLNLSRVRDLHK